MKHQLKRISETPWLLVQCSVCGLTVENRTSLSADEFCGRLGDCQGQSRADDAPIIYDIPPEEQEAFVRAQFRAGAIGSIHSYLDLHANCTETEEEAVTHLDVCLTLCPEHSGTCCRRIEGPCSTKYPRWIEVICEGRCERFNKDSQ